VVLGPSLSRFREGLQQRLGANWIVDDLISCEARPDGPDEVMVLGTDEIEPGHVQVSRRGLASSVLIGTFRRRGSTTRERDASPSILDPLAETLNALTSPVSPVAA
jgi:hypothetical protein